MVFFYSSAVWRNSPSTLMTCILFSTVRFFLTPSMWPNGTAGFRLCTVVWVTRLSHSTAPKWTDTLSQPGTYIQTCVAWVQCAAVVLGQWSGQWRNVPIVLSSGVRTEAFLVTHMAVSPHLYLSGRWGVKHSLCLLWLLDLGLFFLGFFLQPTSGINMSWAYGQVSAWWTLHTLPIHNSGVMSNGLTCKPEPLDTSMLHWLWPWSDAGHKL